MPIPEYDLAPLQGFDPKVFLDNDPDESGFIIALSVFFNDMKDCIWALHFLNLNKPEDLKTISAYNGQFNGQINFQTRVLVGLFWELLTLIKKNRLILKSPGFVAAEKRLSGINKSGWEELKDLALKETSSPNHKKIHKVLKQARNCISFHYYGVDNYFKGFEHYAKTQSNPQIYASLGDQMSRTRFFFADASTQFRFKTFLDENVLKQDDIFNFLKKINHALRWFVWSYVENAVTSQTGSRKQRRKIKRSTRTSKI